MSKMCVRLRAWLANLMMSWLFMMTLRCDVHVCRMHAFSWNLIVRPKWNDNAGSRRTARRACHRRHGWWTNHCQHRYQGRWLAFRPNEVLLFSFIFHAKKTSKTFPSATLYSQQEVVPPITDVKEEHFYTVAFVLIIRYDCFPQSIPSPSSL